MVALGVRHFPLHGYRCQEGLILYRRPLLNRLSYTEPEAQSNIIGEYVTLETC